MSNIFGFVNIDNRIRIGRMYDSIFRRMDEHLKRVPQVKAWFAKP